MMDIPLDHAMIIWSSDGTLAPPIKVVGQDFGKDDPRYENSRGACEQGWTDGVLSEKLNRLWKLFHSIVLSNDVAAQSIHDAFLSIPEYRQAIEPEFVPPKYLED